VDIRFAAEGIAALQGMFTACDQPGCA
jgi:hypothetical protein